MTAGVERLVSRDRPFDFDLLPAVNSPLEALAREVVAAVESYEHNNGLRKRRRKADDQAAFEGAVTRIVANLAHTVSYPFDGRLILPIGNPRTPSAQRVEPGFTGKTLPRLLECLSNLGVLDVLKPQEAGHATSIKIAPGFTQEVSERAVSNDDLCKLPPRQPVTLSERGLDGRRAWLRLPTSDRADRYLVEMHRINEALATAQLGYEGAAIDLSNRYLTRRFYVLPSLPSPPDQLGLGGRMFGGFWIAMRKENRRAITINGEPVVEVDFGQAFPRLAYAAAGSAAPAGDLYSEGPLADLGVKYRAGVKKAFSSLLFHVGTMRRWAPEVAGLLPGGMTVGRFKSALLRAHPALDGCLNVGLGHRLTFTESEITVATCLRCLEEGVVVLPIHDAMICAISDATFVASTMEQVSEEVVGRRLLTTPPTHTSHTISQARKPERLGPSPSA